VIDDLGSDGHERPTCLPIYPPIPLGDLVDDQFDLTKPECLQVWLSAHATVRSSYSWNNWYTASSAFDVVRGTLDASTPSEISRPSDPAVPGLTPSTFFPARPGMAPEVRCVRLVQKGSTARAVRCSPVVAGLRCQSDCPRPRAGPSTLFAPRSKQHLPGCASAPVLHGRSGSSGPALFPLRR